MELRQLEVFRAVATTGSLSRAADTLHLAQPALSRQIKSLETSLGTALFVRTGRGMALTEAGQALLQQSTGLMQEFRRLHESIRSFDGVPRGEVAIGCLPTVGERIAAPLAEKILRDYPEISLRLIEGYTGHLVDWMHRGELDAAVIYIGDERPHVDLEEIGEEELLAVFSADHPTPVPPSISFDQFAAGRVALPARGHGLRSIIDSAAASHGAQLHVTLEADSYRVILDIVRRGLATTVLPASALAQREAEFQTARVTNPRLTRSIALATPVGASRSLATATVLDDLRSLTRSELPLA